MKASKREITLNEVDSLRDMLTMEKPFSRNTVRRFRPRRERRRERSWSARFRRWRRKFFYSAICSVPCGAERQNTDGGSRLRAVSRFYDQTQSKCVQAGYSFDHSAHPGRGDGGVSLLRGTALGARFRLRLSFSEGVPLFSCGPESFLSCSQAGTALVSGFVFQRARLTEKPVISPLPSSFPFPEKCGADALPGICGGIGKTQIVFLLHGL